MSWVSLLLAILKAVNTSVTYMQERKLIQAGQDKEIARSALAILEATQQGKELRAKIAAMDDQEVEELWKDMVK